MGTSGSVNSKPRSPYHRLMQERLRKVQTARYINGQGSDFYEHCANGDIDKVRQILESPNHPPISELVKLERNGDTALHVAAEKGHTEIVRLLLEHKCPRTLLNRTGKRASDATTNPQLQRLFIRSESSDRFHDSDITTSMTTYMPEELETEMPNNETTKFVEQFKNEEDVYEYSLNHQTMAMWLKLYNWISHTFPRLFERGDLHLDSFELHKNTDFNDFLKKKLGDKYTETLEELGEAKKRNSIEPLLSVYSSERLGFYRSLNKQLADSLNEPDTSPHLCDRFIIEFHIRGDELAKRSFLGTAYRGATIPLTQLSVYEKASKSKPRGVIIFKAFTSTSEDKEIALNFIGDQPPRSDQRAVLFVIQTKVKSPTIIGISDVSDYDFEQEILFMPGNIFIVKNIVEDVVTYIEKYETSIILTEIHLEYLHIPVSMRTKLLHTYRSAFNSVTDGEETKKDT